MFIYSVMSFPMKFFTIIATKNIMLSTVISVLLIHKISFIDIGVTDDKLLISFTQLSSAITDKYSPLMEETILISLHCPVNDELIIEEDL